MHYRPTAAIVDDEVSMAEITSEASEIAGYDPVILTSGKQLLDMIRVKPVDIIVLDIVMPDLDGIEVLQACAKVTCRAKFLLMTGYDESYLEYSKVIGIEHGLDVAGTVTKPIDLNDLIHQFRSIRPEKAICHEFA